MGIIVNLQQVNGQPIIGPGTWVQWDSNHNPPFSPPATWRIDLNIGDVAPFDSPWTLQLPASTSGDHVWLMTQPDSVLSLTAPLPANDSVASVTVSFVQPGEVTDNTTAVGTYDSTIGLGQQALELAKATVTGGFTDADRTQLETAVSQTTQTIEQTQVLVDDGTTTTPISLGTLFSGKVMQVLTTDELTAGPTGDQLVMPIGGAVFGIIVRITTIPDWLVPATPDTGWYRADLAVLRIIRGTDLEERIPIHTTSWLHPFHSLYAGIVLNEDLLFPLPPETSVQVDFAFGVEGQVFLMLLP